MRYLLLLLAAAVVPCGAQAQAERLAAAERLIAASVCSAWKPGTGLTVDGNVRRGWVHSLTPGRHELHIEGGTVTLFGQATNQFVQQGRLGETVRYHKVSITAPVGAVLEWTRPDGVREPVPTIFLYPG